MCEDCYTQAGRPYRVTDKVRRTVQLMYDAEQDNQANDLGNGLYMVTGNWNIGDSSIQWCLDNADLSDLERELATLMLTMSLEERHTAMAIETRLVDSDVQVRPYWQAGDKVTVYPVDGGYVVVPVRGPKGSDQATSHD